MSAPPGHGALARRPAGTPAPRGAGREAALSRRFVLRALRGIDGGQLELREGAQRIVLGRPDEQSSLRAVIDVRSPLFYRQLLRGSLGLADSYLDGHWECSDLVAMTRIAARNVGAPRPHPPHRLAPARSGAAGGALASPQHAGTLAAADRRPLRPRQRAVRAVPRRDDDVLLRRLRAARRDAPRGLGGKARPHLPPVAPRPLRPRARDRRRLGRVRAACRLALRLPDHDHDDLARAARLREPPRRRSRSRRPRDGAGAGLPRADRHLRPAGVDRDDRGRRLAVPADLLQALLAAAARRRGDAAAGDRDRRQRLRGREGLAQLHQHPHLPRRLPALAWR